MGTSDHALAGLALSTLLGAVVMLPLGVATAGAALLEPRTLVLGLCVGIASSAIPYSLDLLALRRLSTAVFGVLTSLNPAMAALAGLLVLDQLPPSRQLAGIALVVVASVGVTLTARGLRRSATRGARRRPSDGPSEGSRPPRETPPHSAPQAPRAPQPAGCGASDGPASRAGSSHQA